MQRMKPFNTFLSAVALYGVAAASIAIFPLDTPSQRQRGSDPPVGEAVSMPLTTVTFTQPGNGQWQVPQGVTTARVEVWGAGGSGGGGRAAGENSKVIGGGGGGGAYSRSVLNVTPGSIYQVVVGTGGNQSNGGNSSFGGGLVVAVGGSGAQSAVTSSPGATLLPPGAGGSTMFGVGTVKFPGGSGSGGSTSGADTSGGGGSSAGSASAGTTATNVTGAVAPAGGGNGGAGITENTANTPQPGLQPGGGGGGNISTSNIQLNGAPGGHGQVVITYPALFTANGRVITSTGRGIRSAVITVTGNGLPQPIVVKTYAQGRYIVPDLPVGSYTFTFSSVRFAFSPATRTVTSGDSNVTVPDVVANP